MAVLKEQCPNCGGTILLIDRSKVGECDSCGMTYSLSELQQIKKNQLASKRNALKSDDLVKDIHHKSTMDTDEADECSIEVLCKKAEMALEAEQWNVAHSFSNQIIRKNPKFAKAYLYKLLADYRIFKKEELEKCEKPFAENDNYRLLIRFADVYLKAEIESYSETVNSKYVIKVLETQYQTLCRQASVAITEDDFQKLANGFYKLRDYKDSKNLFEIYLKKFEILNRQKKAKARRKKFLKTMIFVCIVFALIATIALKKASYRADLFSIQITDKINDRFDDNHVYCLFEFEINNNSSHNATYLEGTMTIKDTDDNVLSSGTVWFSGEIDAKSTSYFDLSWEMKRTVDATQIWNTDYAELVIMYKITEIHFDDWTIKEYIGKEVVVNK